MSERYTPAARMSPAGVSPRCRIAVPATVGKGEGGRPNPYVHALARHRDLEEGDRLVLVGRRLHGRGQLALETSDAPFGIDERCAHHLPPSATPGDEPPCRRSHSPGGGPGSLGPKVTSAAPRAGRPATTGARRSRCTRCAPISGRRPSAPLPVGWRGAPTGPRPGSVRCPARSRSPRCRPLPPAPGQSLRPAPVG